MYVIAIAWLYVTVLMAATEPNLTAGVLTFVCYGLLPLALLLWLFGPRAFEVGNEVREAFVATDAAAAMAFVAAPGGKWLCDIYLLARQRLAALGIRRTSGADSCTVSEAGRFFSYRRDGVTGRMATLVWLE